jgi:hypothetical protein
VRLPDLGPFAVDFTDTRFLVKVRSGSSYIGLGTSDLASISVRSYPRNPRAGVALPGDPATPTTVAVEAASFVWRAEGEVGNDLPASAGSVDSGQELSAEMERGLARLVSLIADLPADVTAAPTLPANLDVAIVFESDAPCAFDPPAPSAGPAIRINYQLERHSFADGAEKQVLRFEEARASTQGFSIELPSGAAVSEASLGLDLSLPGNRPGSGGLALVEGELSTATGVRLSPERWAAQPINLSSATTVTAIAVGLVGVVPSSEVTVSLRADGTSAHSARELAAVTQRLSDVGHRGWIIFRLPEPIIVSTAPHWLVVGVASGALLWLCTAGEGTVSVLSRLANGEENAHGGLSSFQGLHALLSVAAPAVDGSDGSPVSVRVAETAASITIEGNRAVVDLSAGLNSFLSSAPDGTTVSAPIRFEALGGGIVTAYPPRISYEI